MRLTGGEPTVRAHLPVLVGKLAALRVPSSSASPLAGSRSGSGADDQRGDVPAGCPRAAPGRARPRQHQPRHAARRPLPADDPARRVDPSARRHRGREGSRLRAGQDQRGRAAWCQRRRDRRPRPLRTRQRRRGAVHRVHAARRQRSLGQRRGRHPRRDRRSDRRGVPARADAVSRRGAGRSVALSRRSRARSA